MILRLAVIAAAAMLVTTTADAANIYARPRPWGGSYIFIVGEIHPGDDAVFKSLNPPYPVWVRPIGPGGEVGTALAIADTIHQRRYNTSVENNDGDGSGVRGCASACTIIWLSGYHVMTRNSSILRFHSCYSPSQDGSFDRNGENFKDNPACNAEVAQHLQSYGYTAHQAWALANASPHEIMRLGTKMWAASLGFTWQTIPGFLGYGNYCQAKFCLAFP